MHFASASVDGKNMQPEAQENILLVDDHSENLLALEAILAPLGHNLIKAHSGVEALRCLLDRDFALILLDVQMPGMNGFETASLIRHRERSENTPIIFLTAFSSSDDLVFKGYAVGAIDYLFKPLEPIILTAKVKVFIDLHQKTAALRRQAAQVAAINAELRQSEERFRALSACAPIGIILTDTAGRCTYSNPACQAIFGFSLEEMGDRSWLQAVHPEDQEAVTAEWSAYIQVGGEQASEFRLQRQGRGVRWIQVRSSPLHSDQGERLGYVSAIADVTERKQAEEARAQFVREQVARAKAEEANRVKDEFLAVLSHELRTPLNPILGWSRLLREGKLDAATTNRALETIERNAQLQTQLIEDLLDVSRILQGKLSLKIGRVSLTATIEAALETVHLAAEAKSIQLQTFCAPEVGPVLGDANRLQQVVWNLLANAVKFTPSGGRVEVHLACVGSQAQIQVSDTGQGIKPEFLPHVFEYFRQADGTTTRVFGGLGLGLAIVRHLVELHGGTVWAESLGEGQGATFWVRLPLTNALSQLSPADAEPGGCPDLQGVQILVVDDEADAREFVCFVLEQHGAQVRAVASASQALSALSQSRPDVLVSDIGMPEMDGYRLMHQVRSLAPEQGGEIPSVALTAYASEADQQRALSAGFQRHVAKPVEPDTLVAVVAGLAGRL